ncbi:MAG TPA: glutamine synthetase III, partial [Ferruginibacter sp.]|nr:glutamine synthetase III [Ferruginibacter sp.]
MNSLRFTAISNFTQREAETEIENTGAITTYFGENVFTLDTARQFLSDEAYKSLVASTKSGNKIDRNMGNQIANGL